MRARARARVCVCVCVCVCVRGNRRRSVLTKEDKRRLFKKGDFTVEIQPLNAFADDVSWTDVFREGWGEDINQTACMRAIARKKEATFKVWARGPPLRPHPYPTDDAGVQYAHGAILDFEKRPVALHSDIALRRWLRSRNVSHSEAKRHTYLGECVCVCACVRTCVCE